MENTPPAVIERFPRLNLKTDLPENLCKTCVHWQQHPANPDADLRAPVLGVCKLNPPTMFLAGMMPVQGMKGAAQPMFVAGQISTGEDDWCGQHKKRPVQE